MKRSHVALAIVSTIFITAGVVTAGYAAFEIYSMNTNTGAQYLPKLAPLTTTNAAVSIEQPILGSVFGSLYIARLDKEIPIIEGTGAKELKQGVGHYVGSVLPGFSDNSVLAGHRDSVFRNLGNIQLGDLLTVRTDWGLFVYEVNKIRIVQADDKTVIVPTSDAVLTLSTCYPFRFVGNAPQRYIVQAGLVVGTPVA